jgi:cbb3-type cytochrome c oxidase subunit III
MWGSAPEAIKATIANGRKAVMPPWGGVLGDDGVKDMAHYVMSLNGSTFDSLRAARGKEKFGSMCAACHGPAGAGLPAQYPRLSGQFAEYSEAQLKSFRDGGRANDPNRMMRAIALKMTDAEMKAVSDYATGLR